jgi:Fe-S-cluster-containing dehydrogenase component
MKKLLIDLEKCYKCSKCTAKCSYYRGTRGPGILRCIALANQEHVCRRCDESPCVLACPRKALEKRPDGMLERYSMRCTSCKTCTIACPFGVIHPQIVEYKGAMCDLCEGRANDTTPPACVLSCDKGALQWTEVEEAPDKDIYAVRKGKFFVQTKKWKK